MEWSHRPRIEGRGLDTYEAVFNALDLVNNDLKKTDGDMENKTNFEVRDAIEAALGAVQDFACSKGVSLYGGMFGS